MTRQLRNGLVALALLLVTGGSLWAAFDLFSSPGDLAAWVPQGALLSIESPDFSTLLHDWSDSPEAAAWIKSDNYAVFSRSHLFGRLQGAQEEFANAAGVPVDTDFMRSIAGKQTFFAWYNIGELQMVYITKMTPAMAEQNSLLSSRKEFATRQAGGVTFYVKSNKSVSPLETGPPADPASATDAADATASFSAGVTERTVAFAVHGDWLVLATEENLMAQTLELMAAKDNPPDTALSKQAWYSEAKSKAAARTGDLRMVLNLKEIVRTPSFRSYWIQKNIAEMKGYRAAVADLTRDATGMHEDRVLLPVSDSNATADTDLGKLAAMVPPHTVVYRATAAPTEAMAAATLQEKLLDRSTSTNDDGRTAPVAMLDSPQVGSVSDLETRIDEPGAANVVSKSDNLLLHTALHGATLQAIMTVDRHRQDAQTDPLWTPFASAVVLQSTQDWDAPAMQQAIRHGAQQGLTAGGLGTEWQAKSLQGIDYFSTSDTHGLTIAFRGRICVVADDASLLVDLLQANPAPAKTRQASLITAFDHQAAAKPFAQWTSTIDRHNAAPATPSEGEAPAFFSRNLKGLSKTFSRMQREEMVESRNADNVRQSVRYIWK